MSLSSGTAFFVGGVALGVFGTAFITHFPTQSSDWAAWAQAVGSMAAIIGAVMVTRMQMRHAENQQARLRARDIEDRLQAVVAIARTLFLAVGRTQRTVRQRIEEKSDYREAIHGFVALSQGGIKALNEIPLHTPPYSSIAREIIVLERALYLYQRRISRLNDEVRGSPATDLHKGDVIVKRMRTELARLRSRVNRILGEQATNGNPLDEDADKH